MSKNSAKQRYEHLIDWLAKPSQTRTRRKSRRKFSKNDTYNAKSK